MTHSPDASVTVLGLGAMGRALASAFVHAGLSTTVWNRSVGKDTELVDAGAQRATTVADAAATGGLVIVCLLNHASIHEVLDPAAHELRGRAVVNLTSTTPEEARELAAWAADHGIDYLDGGIMATPDMIGGPHASILYSGSTHVFEEHRQTLELLGTAEYFGDDAGLAALCDFALLAGMYIMFAGFYHGAAMVRSAGMSAKDFAGRAEAWLTTVAGSFAEHAVRMDSGDYSTSDEQTLVFTKSAVDAIVRASRDGGVAPHVIGPVKALVDQQVADGHGMEAFERIYEGLITGQESDR
ncbi:NAD(P)-dependent oxidoreductase [Phytoactinopolyspora halotolerans]|uniref:NAD(P)-dependent oxidoreductase n=1 Tax=Phytoactinopolyspora halotolerans TaxID=1981512 RepID=A0A6L9S7K6_9ACTN|nr:NAD(P)-binding domain-containing protein [Phytoactinopolyspora halotolerans]NEE00987.1 NAD(P)-dependent oxidoreductase [Phytoactinopolyspora halotolerans]